MGAKQRKGWALPDLDPTDPHSPTRWDLDVTQSACRRLHRLKVPLLPQTELPKGEPLGDIFKTVAPLDIWGLSVFICINHTIGVLWQCLQVSGQPGMKQPKVQHSVSISCCFPNNQLQTASNSYSHCCTVLEPEVHCSSKQLKIKEWARLSSAGILRIKVLLPLPFSATGVSTFCGLALRAPSSKLAVSSRIFLTSLCLL